MNASATLVSAMSYRGAARSRWTLVLMLAATTPLWAQETPGYVPAPGHWPQWFGPNRDNFSTDSGLLQEWPKAGPRLLWKTTGLGDGVPSVAVAGGLVFTLGYHGR